MNLAKNILYHIESNLEEINQHHSSAKQIIEDIKAECENYLEDAEIKEE